MQYYRTQNAQLKAMIYKLRQARHFCDLRHNCIIIVYSFDCMHAPVELVGVFACIIIYIIRNIITYAGDLEKQVATCIIK